MTPRALIPALLLAFAVPLRADDGDWASALSDQRRMIKQGLDSAKAAGAAPAAAPAAPDSCDSNKFEGPLPDLNAPLPPNDAIERLQSRPFPSAFMAWSPAQQIDPAPFGENAPLPDAAGPGGLARHDVIILGEGSLGLKGNDDCEGLSVGFAPSRLARGLDARRKILSANPHAVLLFSVHYYDAAARYLPSDSPWWLRNGAGRVDNSGSNPKKTQSYYMLDYHNADFRAQVARQCKAAVLSGVYDGCFFDWWSKEDDDRLDLLRRVRASVGDAALIAVNVNWRRPTLSAPYINAMYMEGFNSWFWRGDAKGWTDATDNVAWAAQALRPPALPLLEAWFARSRSDAPDLQTMRAITTLVLTRSNGAALFGIPDNTAEHDHAHDWYPFWDKNLGRPKGDGRRSPDGTWRRDFEGGLAVFNPPDHSAATIVFDDGERTSAATHMRSRSHAVKPGDGDLFYK